MYPLKDTIECAADEVIRMVRADALQKYEESGRDKSKSSSTRNHAHVPYYAIHVRRSEFQQHGSKISASEIVKNLDGLFPRGVFVYVSTDDPKGECTMCTSDKDYEPCPKVNRDNSMVNGDCHQIIVCFVGADFRAKWLEASGAVLSTQAGQHSRRRDGR